VDKVIWLRPRRTSPWREYFHVIRCFLGSQKYPSHTRSRSFQPFLHIPPAWQTVRRPRYEIVDHSSPRLIILVYSMQPKTQVESLFERRRKLSLYVGVCARQSIQTCFCSRTNLLADLTIEVFGQNRIACLAVQCSWMESRDRLLIVRGRERRLSLNEAVRINTLG